MFHYFNELYHMLLAIFAVFLLQYLRSSPAKTIFENIIDTLSWEMLKHAAYICVRINSPIGHFIEMLGEFGQIRRTLLALLLRPNQYFRNLNFLEQLSIEQCHLFGNIG